MMRFLSTLVALALAFAPAILRAETYPAYTSTFVNDFANLIEPETEARIEAALKQVLADRGVEMTVVTINSRHDFDANGDIADYATNLFNTWGVGDPARNDGILILVASGDREMRIALGSGYSAIFDDRMQAVIDHYFLPWFRDGNYNSGIEAGVAETIKRSALDYVDPATDDTEFTGGTDENWFLRFLLGPLTLIPLGGAGWVGAIFLKRRRDRRKPRICPQCGRQMERLDETADDAHLAAGQRVEERLKSIDCDVWLCRHDGQTTLASYPFFWSKKPLCPDCGYHTVQSTRRTLHAATQSSTGLAEVTLDCANCDYHHVKTETIPVLTSSSSSSSSGSSFSGGSSSGGGASGSW
jgi:uncharacterized protein